MRYGEMRLLEKTHVVRGVLESYRPKSILDWQLLEQDYAISWILYGLAKTECLSNHLIFKGGTCLRKCCFEKYRFSQELEFAGEQSCLSGTDLETLFIEAMHQTNLEVKIRNYGMKFHVERYKGSVLKPEKFSEKSQEIFMIFVSYPWHREPCIKIKIDVSLSETVHLEKRQQSLIHPYEEDLPCVLYTYSLEEMMALNIISFLKFNAIIQTQGWTCSRIRELYDLWFLVDLPSHSLDKKLVPEIVWKKCLEQNTEFKMPTTLFDPRLQSNFEIAWDQWVNPLILKQMDRESVLPDLKKFFKKMFC